MTGIVIKADEKLIDILDTGTTFIQRRGWVPLNTLNMGANVVFWASAIVTAMRDPQSPFMYIIVLLAGLSLCQSYNAWQKAIGYWENYRLTLQLNAEVLLHREHIALRVSISIISLGVIILELLTSRNIMPLIEFTALIFQWYLQCCKFIGPGDFARKRQESISGAHQES